MQRHVTRIHLIKPPTPSLRTGPISKPPLELLTLASAITNCAFNEELARAFGGCRLNSDDQLLTISDWSSMEHLPHLTERIRDMGEHDLVGVTATTPQINNAHLVSKVVKELYPDTLTILGGPHVTLAPEYSVTDSSFDFLNIGEGIESLPLTIGDIQEPRHAWRASDVYVMQAPGKRLTRTESRGPRLSLNQYPLSSESVHLISPTDYDDSGFVAHGGKIRSPTALIRTNSGCGLPCSFCSVNSLAPVRAGKDIDRVVSEMQGYYSAGFRLFHLVDDVFAFPASRPVALARKLRETFLPGVIEWVFNVRADYRFVRQFTSLPSADNALCEYFGELRAGHCAGISIGVESGDEAVLREADKTTELAAVHWITTMAKESDLGVKWYLMVGLPGQDWKSIQMTVDFLETARPTGIAISILVPHPGTKLYTDPRIRFITREHERLVACPEPKNRYADVIESTIETDAMTADEITRAREVILSAFLSLA